MNHTLQPKTICRILDIGMSSGLVLSILLFGVTTHAQDPAAAPARLERWGLFETAFKSRPEGNPFADVELTATFQQDDTSVSVTGFYDGEGTYRIRFMPETTGAWAYKTRSNRPELDGKTGSLIVTPASETNHGPVRVRDPFHFTYADGTPYREVGTTCYAWAHQSEALQQQTLKTLAGAPFNKLRMCVFPKWYAFNQSEPSLYPFAGTPPATWDFTRFNVPFFQHFEKRIAELRDLGIEADLILFHPYDKGHWGFDRMGATNDDRYLRYLIARFSAYRNVWWSLANEWDLMRAKQVEDWNRFGQILQREDPDGHLRSIHNCRTVFDPSSSWMTHVSYQNDQPQDAPRLIKQYGKPLIYDECRYEGNIPQEWGCITPERMTAMFWKTLVGGAWCGHGETYLNTNLWWSHGGILRGQSPARIAFFKKLIDAAPADAAPLQQRNTWGVEGEYYLTYHWDFQPITSTINLAPNGSFRADVIDTWAMTITTLTNTFSGSVTVPLPGKPYQALRFVKVP